MLLLLPAGMASAAVKDRLDRIGQGVLKPSAGLAALAAVLRSVSGMTSLAAPSSSLVQGAGAAVVTVNPFKWSTYLQHMQVCTDPAGLRPAYCGQHGGGIVLAPLKWRMP